MLKTPFAIKEKRTKNYVLISFAIAIVPTVLWMKTYEKNEGYPSQYVLYMASAIFFIYILSALFSTFYAIKKLCHPKISKESQRFVLVRHMISLFGFMLSQLYIITIIDIWRKIYFKNEYNGSKIWKVTTRWLFITQGIYLPILRMIEPLFFATFKKNVRSVCCFVFCCRRQEKKKEDFIDEQSMIDRNLFTEEELEEDAARFQEMRLRDRTEKELY